MDANVRASFVRPGPADCDAAFDEWGANCGPASLAAALDLQLADVREAVSEGGWFRGYMSITHMRTALHRLGVRHEAVPPTEITCASASTRFLDGLASGPLTWLVCVAWDGPWSSNPRAAAAHRHWIARRGPLVYDVNSNDWMPLFAWEGAVHVLYPKRATGHSFTWACVLECPRLGSSAAPVIMVDQLQRWPHARGIFRDGSAHLTVDGSTPEHIDALHAFAQRIGLRRDWFQDHKLAPHYDLTPARREAALAAGAVFVDAKEQARRRIAARESKS